MRSFNITFECDDGVFSLRTFNSVEVIKFLAFVDSKDDDFFDDYDDHVSVDMDLLEDCKKGVTSK